METHSLKMLSGKKIMESPMILILQVKKESIPIKQE